MCACQPTGIGRRGVSLPETQLLLLLVAVAGSALAALIWGTDSEDDVFAARHNLLKLRRLVGQYRDEHQGRPPADLAHLLQSSNLRGEPSGRPDVSAEFPIARYLWSLPENPLSEGRPALRRSVSRISNHPAQASDVTPGNQGGWLYNPQSGGVWVDHKEFSRLSFR